MTQVSRTSFKSNTTTLYADNIIGSIGADDLRVQMDNIADSVPFITTGNAAAPTVNDDAADTSGNGTFRVGDVWIDETANTAYICLDSTATAAVWQSFGDELAILELSDGSAAAPSLTNSGDTNTGLYFPAADTIAITTAGSEQVRITSSGDVGIGTTSPGATLDVVGGSTLLRLYDGTNNATAKVSQSGEVITLSHAGVASGGLAFATGSGAFGTERMRIDSSGNLGIGTTSPTGKFTVASGTADHIRLEGTSGDAYGLWTSATGTSLTVGSWGNGARINLFDSSEVITFGTGATSTERVRIDSSGNVGIGTNAPVYSVHVANGTGQHLRLERTGVGSYGLGVVSGNALVFDDDGTERMRIDSSGNVGIGTTIPSYYSGKLTVDGNIAIAGGNRALFWNSAGSGVASIEGIGTNELAFMTSGSYTERMRIDSNGRLLVGSTSPTGGEKFLVEGASSEIAVNATSGAAAIRFREAGTERAKIATLGGSGGLLFESAGSEAMRIDSSGNLLVGTTSNDPAYANSAGVAIGSSGYLSMTRDSSIVAFFNRKSTDGTLVEFRKDGTAVGSIGVASSSLTVDVNGSERMRLNSSGDLLVGTTSATYTTSGRGLIELNGSSTALTALKVGNTVKSYWYANGTNVEFLAADGGALIFGTGTGTEKARIDSDGNAGLGTSSPNAISNFIGQTINGTSGSFMDLEQNGTLVGRFAVSSSQLDIHNKTANPITFNVNDAEAARIDSSRTFMVGKTASGSSVAGFEVDNTGNTAITRNNGQPLLLNRLGSDGDLVLFRQAGVTEGTITVSGSTVSYNNFLGAHYSELVTEAEDLPMGTIAETAGGACVDESDGRLPKFRVGETQGSKAVYGTVLGPAWMDEEDGNVNLREAVRTKYRLSGVGAGWIRMKAGETPELGDLIQQSDVRGCGEVQDDDIIRSKTVAKITSLEVKETYADGSYVLPAVMLAG